MGKGSEQRVPQRSTYGQQSQGKMLDVVSRNQGNGNHQGNGNQNHSDAPPHTHWHGQNKNK